MGREQHGAVNSYKEFMRIADHRILSVEEEKQLAKRARHGDKKAKDELILCNSRFVMDYVYLNYHPNDMETEFEMIQAGLLGMIRAIVYYNESNGFRFITYSKYWMIKEIEEYLRTTYRVCYTAYGISNINKFNKVKREMEECGTELDITKLANRLNWSIAKTTEVYFMSVLHEEVSYDKKISSADNDNNGKTLLETGVFYSEIGNPEEEALDNSRCELVRELLNGLSEEKRKVLQMYYYEGKKYAQIAEILDIPKSVVETLSRKAKTELKCKLAAKHITSLEMVI